MSRRDETVDLGRNAPRLEKWIIERDSDADFFLTVNLPDVDGSILSTDTIDEGICHIKKSEADTTPLVIIGTGTRDYMTITRPNPNQVLIAIELPPSVTQNDLNLTPEAIGGADLVRAGIPQNGDSDIRLELATGKIHFVARIGIQADRMITHPSQEPD